MLAVRRRRLLVVPPEHMHQGLTRFSSRLKISAAAYSPCHLTPVSGAIHVEEQSTMLMDGNISFTNNSAGSYGGEEGIPSRTSW